MKSGHSIQKVMAAGESDHLANIRACSAGVGFGRHVAPGRCVAAPSLGGKDAVFGPNDLARYYDLEEGLKRRRGYLDRADVGARLTPHASIVRVKAIPSRSETTI